MRYAIAYIAALLVYGAIDAVWLSLTATVLYRETLGDLLLPDLRIGPAIVFYLMYPLGVVVFATAPALKSGSSTTASASGFLLGAFAYATYDLTNYATLRIWSMQITAADIAYGAVVSGIAATAAFAAVRVYEGSISGTAR